MKGRLNIIKTAKKIFLFIFVLCIAVYQFSFSALAEDKTGIERLLDDMTTEEKIAQMITVDMRSWNNEDFTEMNDEAEEIIKKYAPGGVILFAENLKNTKQIVKLTSALQDAALKSENKIPLIIGTDQEGGEIVRLNTGTSLPGNMALGANGNKDDSFKAGDILGSELLALGINTDYAPSLDVNNNPLNPVIGLRSFSADPDIVGALGVQVIKGLQNNNVISAAKHFPGHGDTQTDSHAGLPSVDKSKEELDKTELAPFKKAVENGVDMIMTAHIQFPKVEASSVISQLDGSEIKLPATLSKKFVTDILRGEMGFNGVVTTDAMNMEAIASSFGLSQAAILAINAGVDMLLMPVSLTCSDDADSLAALINDIKSAVDSGEIKEDTINNAVKRILKLKNDRGILNYKASDLETKIKNAEAIVGSKEHREIEDSISTNAVTLVKNEKDTLPFKPEEGERAVFVTPYSNEIPGIKYALTKLMASGKLPQIEYSTVYYNGGSGKDDILNKISQADYVVIFTEMNESGDILPDSINTYIPRAVLNYTEENSIKNVIVSIGKPYDIANYTDADAIVAAYGAKGMEEEDADGTKLPVYAYGPNIPAAVEVIFGEADPFGKLPVDIPNITDGEMDTGSLAYKLGEGLTYEGAADNRTEPATQSPTSASPSQPQQSGVYDTQNFIQKNIILVIAAAVILLTVTITVTVVLRRRKRSMKKRRYK